MARRREFSQLSKKGRVVDGGERAEDKRKRQAAQAVTAARGSGGGNRGMIAGIAIVVVLAVVVGVGLWLQNRNKPDALPVAIPVAAAGVQYPVSAQGDAIVTGSPQAPTTIDVYEDFMCPICGQFEKLYHPRLAQAAADGKAKVVYHPVAILDQLSVPPGYSTLAAGATYCATEADIFPRFHDSLFAAQPAEGGQGWTTAQLQQLGRSLGAGARRREWVLELCADRCRPAHRHRHGQRRQVHQRAAVGPSLRHADCPGQRSGREQPDR